MMDDARLRRYAYLVMLTILLVGPVLVYMYVNRTLPAEWCEDGWRVLGVIPVMFFALFYFSSFLLAKSFRYFDIRWKIFSLFAALYSIVAVGWTVFCSSS